MAFFGISGAEEFFLGAFTAWTLILIGAEFFDINENGVIIKIPGVISFTATKFRAPIYVSLGIIGAGLLTRLIEAVYSNLLFPILDGVQIIGGLFTVSAVTIWYKTHYNVSIELLVYLTLGISLLLNEYIISFAKSLPI